MIVKIAVNDQDGQVRLAAAEQLMNQMLIAEIAVSGEDWQVRTEEVRKLTDQNVLSKIASDDANEVVRLVIQLRPNDISR